jgi:hypothetical protein
MGNFSDGIIRDVDNIQFSNNIVTNVHCIKEVTTEERAIGDLIINFYVDIDDYSKLVGVNDVESITFFDLVGFGEKYKQLFNEFERNTNLSKEKISGYLRHATTGQSISNEQIEFKFVISPSFLIEKDIIH